eukprot:symbB.v1.2.008209.t1/scaffold492.1/size196413/12
MEYFTTASLERSFPSRTFKLCSRGTVAPPAFNQTFPDKGAGRAPAAFALAAAVTASRRRRKGKMPRPAEGLVGHVKWLHGLREIANDYDAFIFDLWGVVHNGSVGFPWARDCLVELQKLRKPVLFLTNQAALERLGISPDLYVDLITSGEVSWKILKGTCAVMDEIAAIRDAKAILTFGNGSDDVEYMADLPAEVAVNASEADLLLARGCFSLYGDEVRSASWEEPTKIPDWVAAMPNSCAAGLRCGTAGGGQAWCQGSPATNCRGFNGLTTKKSRPRFTKMNVLQLAQR